MKPLIIALCAVLMCGTAWAEKTANLVIWGLPEPEVETYFQMCFDEKTGPDSLNGIRCEKILAMPTVLEPGEPLVFRFVRDIVLTWPDEKASFKIYRGATITFGEVGEKK